MVVKDWSKIRYFKEDELRCKHTGQCKMDLHHMELMDQLRQNCGFPINITSGYRHPSHPIEAAKPQAGEHAYGMACDVQVPKHQRHELLKHAMVLFPRIGVSNNFIHLGSADNSLGFPAPRVWGY